MDTTRSAGVAPDATSHYVPSRPSSRRGRGAVRLLAGASSRGGRKRRPNEDACALSVDDGVFLVADGMGGHPRGDLVSRRTVDELRIILARDLGRLPARDHEAMLDALRGCIVRFAHRLAQLHPDGGTTLVAAYARGTRLFIAHLGDSRVYRYREGQIRRLTRDYTVVQNMVDAGVVDDLSAVRHPERGALTRYLGLGQVIAPTVRCVRVRPGDRVLLCTDGIHSVLPTPALERVLGCVADPAATGRALVDLVASRCGRDDATALVLEWS